MASKKELKKFVRNTCGALAAEILLAYAAFPEIERKAVYNVIVKVASLQESSISRVNISFDKGRKAFSDDAEYNKARAVYFRKAYGKLIEEFNTAVSEIVKDMNAALPEDVRAKLKEAAAK